MGELYDIDVLAWSERQAGLLREHAAANPSNKTLDWDNIIEEVESVGRSQLLAVRSLLVQAMLHDLKCLAWPTASYVPQWRAEARGMRADAADAYTPSMRQGIDVAALYRRALDRLPASVDGQPPLAVPLVCTATLDALILDAP